MTLTIAGAERTRFLRLALGLDAAVTSVNGLAYLIAAGPLSGLLGPDPGMLRAIGAFLLIYGLMVGVLAARPQRSGVIAVIAINLLWVLGSLTAAWMDLAHLTVIGTIWTIAQAAVVAAFAALQAKGLRGAR